MSEGINTIANGNLDTVLCEKGTKEIATIAKSTNILSKKLKRVPLNGIKRYKSYWINVILFM